MKKPTLIAVVVFAVLLAAFVLTREKNVSVGMQRLSFPALKADAISGLSMTGGATASLTKAATGWVVADPAKAQETFVADDGAVQGLLGALGSLRAGELVTSKTEKHAEYEVDAAKGVKLVVTRSDGSPFELVLGKASKSGGTYVRTPSGNEVFSTPAGLSWHVHKSVKDWRDKRIKTAALADVKAISVTQANGEKWAATGKDDSWALEGTATPKDFRFDGAAAKSVVSQFTSLTAQDFISGETPDFSKATTVVATLSDGKSVTVKVGEKRADSNLPLQVEGDSQLYVVSEWVGTQLTKKLDGLRDLTLLSFDPAKVTKLTVTAEGKKTVVIKEGESWKLLEPKGWASFDARQVPTVLSRLRNARGNRVVPTAANAALKPVVELQVTGGPSVSLKLGAEAGSGEIYAQGSDGLLYATAAGEKAFWKGPEIFNTPAPPPNFGGGMNGLDQLPPEIRKQLEAQLRQQGMQP
jgi:hypothetical protein